MPDRFLQIHTLTPYAGVLLNRDDAGFAKRLPFGGVVRTRVSSQCLKRHWRTYTGENSLADLDVPMSVRSRHSIQLKVVDPLLAEGLDKAAVEAAAGAVMKKVVGVKESALKTGQIVVLGEPELQYMRDLVRQMVVDGLSPKDMEKGLKGDLTKNLGALGQAAGLDAALFGRMTTSDVLARGDAAIHVAHAFTVHEQEAEDDYFSAIDDLLSQSEDETTLGSGHIGSTELTSGLFYGYVVVDVPLLVSNLTGVSAKAWTDADRTLAAAVVERLVQIITTVSPGAKLGSTAPYAHAHAVIVEAGRGQPRTLANAFYKPVRGPDVLDGAYRQLAQYIQESDAMYEGLVDARAVAAMQADDAFRDTVRAVPGVRSVRDIARWASERVLQ